jgi:glutamate/aspartate transport system ATP-binding protein
MVFQHFELFPHLSVTENLTIAQIKVLGRTADDAKKRGLKMLDRVGLTAHKDKFPASSPAASSSAWRLPARCRWTPS